MRSDRLRDWLPPHNLFIRVVTLGSLLILLMAVAQSLAPLAWATDLHAEESPEAFLERAYGQRARAMTLGDATLLNGLYDPAGTELLQYEKARVGYFQDGFWASLRGKVLTYHSTIRIEEVATAGSTFKARLYETLEFAWIPGAKELPPWTEEVRRLGPRRYASGAGRGPHGEIISGMGTPHEVTLVKGEDGWRMSRDLYREFMVGEIRLSPGTVVGSWAAPEWTGGPIPGRVYPPVLPLTGSAGSSSSMAAMMGALLLCLGLVARSLGGRR